MRVLPEPQRRRGYPAPGQERHGPRATQIADDAIRPGIACASMALLVTLALAGCTGTTSGLEDDRQISLALFASTMDSEVPKDFLLRIYQGNTTFLEDRFELPEGDYMSIGQIGPFQGAYTVELQEGGAKHDWHILPRECPQNQTVMVSLDFSTDAVDLHTHCNEKMELY